jgi:homoserine O-succinyltransferase
MPVFLNSKYGGHERRSGLNWPRVARLGETDVKPWAYVHIGLVNNMGDAALAATAHQFLTLLEDASTPDMRVQLTLYTLPGLARKPAGQRHVNSFYRSVEELWSPAGSNAQPDALIVTGREPLTSDLRDEDYWGSFVQLLNWARENTLGAVWSCLAAHAAILQMDGIERIRSAEKHFGIFEVEKSIEHELIAGLPERFCVPHSRWNGIAPERLTDRGYELLTRARDGSVDAFSRDGKSLFLFFQGHPEYESDTLLREYRRDAGRFLRNEAATYPNLPLNYFDEAAAESLSILRERAIAARDASLLTDLGTILKKVRIRNTWHTASTAIYRNWLAAISDRKRLNSASA